jgi:hypothetical protein
MYGSAARDAGHTPGWGELRQAVKDAAEACAVAVAGLCLLEADPGSVRAAERAVAVLRDLGGCIRPLAFDEAVVEAERAQAATEALTAAGVKVPTPRRERHLHPVR